MRLYHPIKQVFQFLLANFFHSGSGPIMHIILASIFPIIVIYSFYKKNLKIFYNFGISFLFGILIAFSKISSSLYLLKNLPRSYPQTEYISTFHFSMPKALDCSIPVTTLGKWHQCYFHHFENIPSVR